MTQEGIQTRGRTMIVTAAVAGLEFAWLYILLRTANAGLHLGVFVPSLLLVYAVSFACTLGLRALALSPRTTTVLSWAIWPLATLLLLVVVLQGFSGISHAVKAAVFIVMAAGVLWWLGGRLARGRMTYETVLIAFQFGLIVLAGSVFVGYLADVGQTAAVLTSVAFVALGLVGAAAARVGDEGGPLFARRGGSWWGMLLISVTLVLMLGVLAGLLFSPELMQFIVRGFRALWGLIDRLFDAVASIFPSDGSETSPVPVVPSPEGQGSSSGPPQLPSRLGSPFRIVYYVFVIGVVLVAAWSFASQLLDWMRRRTGGGRVEMESLPGAFRLDLARLFRRMLAWVGSLVSFARLRRKPHEEPAQTTCVRRLYADMLRWGAESGFPRGSSQTPFEYQQILCVALPGHGADVTFITETYVRAKYGAEPPTDAELHQVKESRHRLKRRAARAVDSRPTSRPADKAEDHGDTHRQAF
jgi:hypothetical protein